ncbi:MAG: glycosyltransferase [Fuerstiella sp.]
MRIYILALGSRGDVELFVALGSELQRRGHDVVVGTSRFLGSIAKDAGLPWMPMGDGSEAEFLNLLRGMQSEPDLTARTRQFGTHWLQPQYAACRAELHRLLPGFDYFINNLKLVVRRGGRVMPGISVTYDPPLNLADLPKYGPPEKEILDLVAINRQLIDPGNEWDKRYQFTGFWLRPPAASRSVSDELRAFVHTARPTVVLAMGSMVMFDSVQMLQVFEQALQLADCSGVVVAGWSRFRNGAQTSDRIRCVQEADYDWLFPHASCVVHHGGTGTLAAVLRAGVPSVILPQITCQQRFAELLLRESLAVNVFSQDTLSSEALAAAFVTAQTCSKTAQAASTWQAVISAEDGVGRAADLIQHHWSRVSE